MRNREMERPKTSLVKVERTKTEIRDDVAVRVYVERIMEDYSASGEMPDADRLRELAQHALDAGFVFFQERYEDKRIIDYMNTFSKG
jgi:hypothetical protein